MLAGVHDISHYWRLLAASLRSSAYSTVTFPQLNSTSRALITRRSASSAAVLNL